MIRKWTMVLLSLLIALMLPMSAMAGTQHTLTIIPGDDMALDPAITDLLNVFSITLTPGAKSGALTISLDDMDVGTIAMGADTTALYVHSPLISDDVLHVTWDDAVALMKNGIQVSMSGEGADQAAIDAMLEQVDVIREEVTTALGGGMMLNRSTQEETLAQAEEMFKDDPQMLEYIHNIIDKQVIEDGTFADEKRDTADQKYSLMLTTEDFASIFKTNYMQQFMRESLAQENPDMSAAEMDEMLKAQLDELQKLFEDSELEMSCVAYTLDAGRTMVGMEMSMDMTVSENDDAQKAVVDVRYDRLTNAEGVSHKAHMNMTIDDAELMQVLFDFHRGVDEVSEGTLAFLVEGEELQAKYHAENPAADMREREVAFYLRSGAEAIIEPAASNRPIITFRVVTAPAAANVLEAIEKADTSNSVDVMKLSEDEMQALMEDAASRLMQAAFSAMGKLPTSTLNLVLGAMGMAE